MSITITVRLTPELKEWLTDASRRTGLPAGRIVRDHLEEARMKTGKPYLKLAGMLEGPRDLSTRKGYSPR